MAMNEAECREMIRVADECDRRLMVAYTMRFRPAPARLKELLVEGSYGPPFKVSAWTQGFLDPRRPYPALGGAARSARWRRALQPWLPLH